MTTRSHGLTVDLAAVGCELHETLRSRRDLSSQSTRRDDVTARRSVQARRIPRPNWRWKKRSPTPRYRAHPQELSERDRNRARATGRLRQIYKVDLPLPVPPSFLRLFEVQREKRKGDRNRATLGVVDRTASDSQFRRDRRSMIHCKQKWNASKYSSIRDRSSSLNVKKVFQSNAEP